MFGETRTDPADAKQADAFLIHLEVERRELVAERAKLTQMGGIRRAVLALEGDIRHIDRMVDALQRRFPIREVSRRA